MGYFQVRYASRVVINKHKMFIRLATGPMSYKSNWHLKHLSNNISKQVSFQQEWNPLDGFKSYSPAQGNTKSFKPIYETFYQISKRDFDILSFTGAFAQPVLWGHICSDFVRSMHCEIQVEGLARMNQIFLTFMRVSRLSKAILYCESESSIKIKRPTLQKTFNATKFPLPEGPETVKTTFCREW